MQRPDFLTFAAWVRFNELQGVAAYVAKQWAEGDGGATIAFVTGLYEQEVDAIIDWIVDGRAKGGVLPCIR